MQGRTGFPRYSSLHDRDGLKSTWTLWKTNKKVADLMTVITEPEQLLYVSTETDDRSLNRQAPG